MRNFATGFEEKAGDHWIKSLQSFLWKELTFHTQKQILTVKSSLKISVPSLLSGMISIFELGKSSNTNWSPPCPGTHSESVPQSIARNFSWKLQSWTLKYLKDWFLCYLFCSLTWPNLSASWCEHFLVVKFYLCIYLHWYPNFKWNIVYQATSPIELAHRFFIFSLPDFSSSTVKFCCFLQTYGSVFTL